jgi:Sporulation and spore germination
MKPFLEALRRLSVVVGRSLVVAYKRTILWLSFPVNFCLAVLGLVFLVSFASWAIGRVFDPVVLWFPDSKGSLRGEIRQVPVSWGAEARAELVTSELLLGPKTMSLHPDFPPGIRVESVMYRKGRLFVDISLEAALEDAKSLKNGLAALERSLRAALPGLRRLTVTIGGTEPYTVGLKVDGARGAKKAGK